MENNELIEKQIDDFIMGLLNQKDSQAFQQRLEKDAVLAEAVKLRREMIEGVEAYGRKIFKDELKDIHQEVIAQPKAAAKSRNLRTYLTIAATVAVLITAIVWLMNQNANPNPQELYAAYFTPYDLSGLQRSQTDPELMQLKDLYKNGKYADALPLLKAQLNKAENKSSALLLATGISFLETNQVEKALAHFQQITNQKDFNFADEVKWYSALAYLKQGDLTKAKDLFQELAKDKNADHHLEAQKMIKALPKN